MKGTGKNRKETDKTLMTKGSITTHNLQEVSASLQCHEDSAKHNSIAMMSSNTEAVSMASHSRLPLH